TPQMAGVGCNAVASVSEDVHGSARRPVTRVDRCHIVAVFVNDGVDSTSTVVQYDRRASATARTTSWCSFASLADSRSLRARSRSSATSTLRGSDPASGFAVTVVPVRRTSNSGLAPTNVRLVVVPSTPEWEGRSTAKTYAVGS